jgi:cycloeucalenol cycloisomerase
MAVLAFSYFTAFMETLTISSFPYYAVGLLSTPPPSSSSFLFLLFVNGVIQQFADRKMVYRLGSAFYGIYFIVSFPAFLRIDKQVGQKDGPPAHTPLQVCFEALGSSMAVLLLLDFCRLACGIPLTISGKAYYLYQ